MILLAPGHFAAGIWVGLEGVIVQQVDANGVVVAEGKLKGILGYTTGEYGFPLVSMDFKGDPRSSIVDLPTTMVMGGKMIKVVTWYDNEWGYSCRTADLAAMTGKKL